MAEYQISARLTLKDQMTAQLRTAASAAEKLTRGVGSASKGIGDIKLNVQGLEKLQRYRDLLRQAGMTQPKPINLRVNDNGATSKISKVRSDITSLAGRAWNVAVNIKTNGMAALRNAKTAISEMATGAAMGMGAGMMGVAGVGFGAVNMIDTYKDFEYQMKRNKALFTTGLDAAEAEKQYQDLVTSARHYGSIMKFTASEVGKAQEYMALAGWDSQKAIAALPAVLNAAVASGEDLALVSDIITDDMTAMGYKAGDVIQNAMGENVEAAQHFADVMLRTTLRSNTNFQQLGLAMKYAAPLAHTLGFKIEEVAVAMGLMANNGIKADQAGTGLRGILNRLINEPKRAAQALGQLGVKAFDETTGKAKGLLTTLMDIRAAMKGKDAESMVDFVEEMSGEKIENRHEVTDFLKDAMARGGGKLSEKDQAKLGSMLSGTYALSAFMAIMNSTDEDIKKLMEEIYHKSDGTGAGIAKEMADTMQGDLDTMKSAWEDFNVELLTGAGASGLRGFIQTLTKDINQFKTSLKDGLDLGDIGKLGITVLDQLKDKFMQLDGIGSVLAGGALFMAMKKILSMGLKLKDTLSAWSKVKTMSDLGGMIRGNQGGVIGTSQVGTMHVSAGVVNLTGAIRGVPATGGQFGTRGGGVVTTGRPATTGGIITTGGRPATTGGISPTGIATAGAATAGSILVSSRGQAQIARQQQIAARNSAYVNDYYARRASYVPPTPPITSPIPLPTATGTGAMGAIRANAGGIAGMGALSLMFGAMDIYSARQHSAETSREAAETLAYHKNVLAELQSQGASSDQIAVAMKNVQDAEAFVGRTQTMNANVENQAQMGAAGMTLGSLLGGALGSVFPVVGTGIGAMLGGMLGQWGGSKLAEYGNAKRDERIQNGGGTTQVGEEPPNRTAPKNTSGMGIVIGDERETNAAWRQHEEKTRKGGGVGDFKTKFGESAGTSVTGSSSSSIERPEGIDDLAWAQMKRRQADIDERNSYLQNIENPARAKALAHQRDLYNKRWQEQFGGTSLGGQAKFDPGNERDRKLLADYDRQQAYKKLGLEDSYGDKIAQQKRLAGLGQSGTESSFAEKTPDGSNTDWYKKNKIEDMPEFKTTQQAAAEARAKTDPHRFDWMKDLFSKKSIEGDKSLAEKSIADQKATMDKIAETNRQWNQQQKDTLDTLQNQKKLAETAKNASQENKGLLGVLDDLLFSKAAANPITSDTNVAHSTAPVPSEIQPPAPPKKGFFDDFFDFEFPDFSKIFDFKLPDFSKIFSDIKLPDLSGLLDKLPNLSEMFSNIELPNFSEIFSGIELPDLSSFLDKLPNISEIFSGVETPNLGEMFNFDFEIPDFGSKISELFSNVEVPDLGTRFSEIFSGIEMPELGIGEKISAEFDGATAVFESFSSSAMATFSGLAGSIGGALSGVGSAITTVFQSAASQVQSIWGAMPGYFSGIFGSLGGVAAAAGAAIASGLTSAIGTVIGAWSAAAATISGIISSIASAASSAASAAGGLFSGGIGGHAKGTSYFEGGFTEVNEHGGEIINLPKGTQIIPHATTVNILRHEIRNRIDSGATDFHGLQFSDYGLSSTSNIVSGDKLPIATRNKPNKTVRQGQRWNMKSKGGIFGTMMEGKLGGWGGILATIFGNILLDDYNKSWGEKTALGGDVIMPKPSELEPKKKAKVGQRWNMPNRGIFGGLFGGNIFGGGGFDIGNIPAPIMTFGGDMGLPMINTMTQSQPFSDDFNLSPSNFTDKFDLEVPKYETPKVAESSSNTTSNSNNFNFGGVTINNGSDFDEFVFRLQKLLGYSTANSEMV